MLCPRCEGTTLNEREREGITIDVCSGCRGVWLDRGELEKLIARATRDLEALEYRSSQPHAPAPPPYASSAPPPYRHDDTPPRGTPRYEHGGLRHSHPHYPDLHHRHHHG